nr:hypothetical protein [Pseudomonas sp. PS01298]
MATLVKTPSGTWKALIRKNGWPTVAKTFRTKRDAEDWSRLRLSDTKNDGSRTVPMSKRATEVFKAAMDSPVRPIDSNLVFSVRMVAGSMGHRANLHHDAVVRAVHIRMVR